MNIKTLNVFYGEDFLPYKDNAREVHYPNVGSDFQGANEISEIHFYTDRIGDTGSTTFAVAIELPNGKIGSKVIAQSEYDEELHENYVVLPIDDFITRYVGNVTISLRGYQGDIELEYDEDTQLYVLVGGTPITAVTGGIKLRVNQVPQGLQGDLDEEVTLQELLGLVDTKLNIKNGIVILGDISTANLSGYEVGQLFYDKDSGTYYEKTATSPYYKKAGDESGVLGSANILCKNGDSTLTISKLHEIYGNRSYFVYRYLDKDILFNINQVALNDYNCIAFDIENQCFYEKSVVSGSALPSSVLIPANKVEIASKAFLVSNYVPYNGANADVDLGEHYIKTKGVKIEDIYHTIEVVSDDLVIGSGSGDIWLQPDGIARYITSRGYGDAYKVGQYEIANTDFVLDQCQDISSMSVLDETALAYASRPNAVLKINDLIYRYAYEDSNYIYYKCANDEHSTNLSGYDTYTLNSIIRIDKSNGAVGGGQASFDFYNKTQSEGKFATNFTASLNTTTYVLTFTLKNANGDTLATQTIDLPLESIVTSMLYYDEYTYGGTTYHNVLVIVLATTSVPTIVPVGSLISGLEHEALVEVSNISTPLTASQLALLEYPNAMITYGNDVYLKAEDNGTYITLSVPYISLTTDSGHEEATRKFIVVTKSSGAMALTSDTTSFYNKSQADTLLGEKADASSVVTDSDIETLGGAVTRIRKGNTWNEVAKQVDMSTTPKVVQSVADLPADNDGYLYVVLDNGYLYSWDEENQEWAQQYQYTSDLLTITEVAVGDDDYSYIADKTNNNRPIQVESAKKDANGEVIDETYAKISDLENGLIEPEVSKTAKNLLPVSQSSGSVQTAPFINQGTATNNNDSQAQVDTGTLGQHLEKQGHTLAVNQLFKGHNLTSKGITQTLNADGGITFSGTYNSSNTYEFIAVSDVSVNMVAGHKYLVLGATKLHSIDNSIYMHIPSVGGSPSLGQITADGIYTPTTSGSPYVYMYIENTAGTITTTTLFIRIIDLTIMFNGDIPQDLSDHPDNFHHYYNGSLDYNLGTLVNSNGRYLVNGNQNAWDEKWELGYYNANTGEKVADNNYIRSKNPIPVIPNTDYYYYLGDLQSNVSAVVLFYDNAGNFISSQYPVKNSVFTTPSNCTILKMYLYAGYGNIYKHDITISLYYAGEDYSQYIPYKAPAVYDTGSEELKQAGRVKDYKEPNGTIHHLIRGVNLGTLTWYYDDSTQRFYSNAIDDIKNGVRNVCCICPIYSCLYNGETFDANWNMVLYIASKNIYVHNHSYTDPATFKTAMNGIYLYYELATPTTEQGSPFTENMDINDMGNMAWYSAYTDENTNTLVSVPQGCKIFYPAWYVGFIDTLGQREDIEWSADEIVSQDQLGEVDDKHDNLYAIVNQNLGGILRQLLATKESLDFSNTAYVDMGSLSWAYSENAQCFTINLQDKANGSSKLLSTLYKTENDKGFAVSNMCITGATGSDTYNKTIFVKNTSYNDETAFKNAMKGMLLAYEKAS